MPDAAGRLGILLMSGTYERAHYAFVVATAAAAMDRSVILFATNEGIRGLLADWSGLQNSGRDAAVRECRVAGLQELREAAAELGVRLLACEAGLRLAAIDAGTLPAGVEVAGVGTFLDAVAGGQIMTL